MGCINTVRFVAAPWDSVFKKNSRREALRIGWHNGFPRPKRKKLDPSKSQIWTSRWCRQPGSNRHAFERQQILSLSCLPIPSWRHWEQYKGGVGNRPPRYCGKWRSFWRSIWKNLEITFQKTQEKSWFFEGETSNGTQHFKSALSTYSNTTASWVL